jgi:hypothetical protein
MTAAGLRALAGHLDQALAPLTLEISALSARAAAEHSERDDRWAPIAAEVSSWCADAKAALDGAAPVASIKAADKWLKAATDDIRNDRLAPLADQARGIWAMLRQESNVDLGSIRLAGSATNRHVELDVSVDGAPGSALGVMSQGEVNALALSLFLPRAAARQPVPLPGDRRPGAGDGSGQGRRAGQGAGEGGRRPAGDRVHP